MVCNIAQPLKNANAENKKTEKRTMALLKTTEQDKKKTAGGFAENGIFLCPVKKAPEWGEHSGAAFNGT